MENRDVAVRMVLWDYDAAPDGDGMYVVIDAKFASVELALNHRSRMWCGDLYWGHIEDADGKTIMTLRTKHEEEADEHYDWYEHEAKCDGCSTCNPTAFRDDDLD